MRYRNALVLTACVVAAVGAAGFFAGQATAPGEARGLANSTPRRPTAVSASTTTPSSGSVQPAWIHDTILVQSDLSDLMAHSGGLIKGEDWCAQAANDGSFPSNAPQQCSGDGSISDPGTPSNLATELAATSEEPNPSFVNCSASVPFAIGLPNDDLAQLLRSEGVNPGESAACGVFDAQGNELGLYVVTLLPPTLSNPIPFTPAYIPAWSYSP
jgi:hypothetical protein